MGINPKTIPSISLGMVGILWSDCFAEAARFWDILISADRFIWLGLRQWRNPPCKVAPVNGDN